MSSYAGAASSAPPGPERTDGRRWLGLIVISLVVAVVIVDVTIVNVALPRMIDDLGMPSTTAQWAQEGYLLAFAALLLTFGRVADRLGRRRVLMAGVAVFAAASAAAALSPNGAALVGSRVLQGVGAAAVLPCSLSLINAAFPGRSRAAAFAVWGSIISGVTALGPLLGGWLITDFSWRWAFWINIPIALAVIAGAAAFIAESRDDDAEPGADIVGSALSVIAAVLLVFGLIEGRSYGWWRADPAALGGWPVPLSPVPIAFALALAAMAAFIAWEVRRTRRGRAALLDMALFEVPSFARGTILVALVALGELGLLFVLPLWLQNAVGYDALAVGFVLAALAGGAFLAAGAAPGIARHRGIVSVVRTGLGLEILALCALGALTVPDPDMRILVPALAVYGFGVGLSHAQLPNVVLSDIPPAKGGQASAVQSTAQEIGSALGVAILGTVLFIGLADGLHDRLDAARVPPALKEEVVESVQASGGAVIADLDSRPHGAELADAARAAFAQGAGDAAFTAAAILLAGFIASFSVRVRRST